MDCDDIMPDDASAMNLHITDPVYEMKGCVKPHPEFEIFDLIENFDPIPRKFEEDDTILLDRNSVYIFKVKESLNLRGTGICGQATGKSTFGRLDILTRLLVSFPDSYDVVPLEFGGILWVEICPITFPIKIKKGQSLNQLRLFKGLPEVCRINNRDLSLWGNLILGKCGDSPASRENLTLNLSEDPSLGNSICAYGAKPSEGDEIQALDLTINLEQGDFITISDYWETLKPTVKRPLALGIEPERFYILRSQERFKLPKSVAIYCQAVAETLGELRIHYAGFVHPRFGEGREDEKGAPLIFEVRGHNVRTYLQDGETLARLEYYSMSQDAEEYSCNYSSQELTLSKYFKDQ